MPLKGGTKISPGKASGRVWSGATLVKATGLWRLSIISGGAAD